jgi:hypothetical protein
LRDPNIMIIGFLVLAVGWVFQITISAIGFSRSSAIYGNAGTVLQLIGTLTVIAGVVILVIGFLKFVKGSEDTSILNYDN